MTKEFLSRKGVPYTEKNVAVDRVAAQEMINKSGQMGVPQTLIGDEIVVGFNRGRLESLLRPYETGAQAAPKGVSLGVRVADAKKHTPDGRLGAYIGQVKPGSLAERGGLRVGDVVISADGQPIVDADDLIKTTQAMRPGSSFPVVVMRDGKRQEVMIRD
jgi:S1-C subfamily serine protease